MICENILRIRCGKEKLVENEMLNPLPEMPILGSSNSAANKDNDVKNGTNVDTIICVKTLWEKEKLLASSNFSFSRNVFKNCLLLMRQKEYPWSKRLTVKCL